MEISALWRYPIKSLGGERLEVAPVEARGIVGDRGWAVIDPDGKLGSGKSSSRFRAIDGLLHLSAVIGAAGVPEVTGPFGRLPVDDPALAPALSAHLGAELRVAPEADVAHHDDAPVHLVSTAGLRWLAAELGTDESADDLTRRFRPNVVIAADGAEPVEDGWVAGTEVAIGDEVVLRITKPTVRCVMTSMSQPGLAADRTVQRTVGRVHDASFGVYAEVVGAGTLRLGDHVTVHESEGERR